MGGNVTLAVSNVSRHIHGLQEKLTPINKRSMNLDISLTTAVSMIIDNKIKQSQITLNTRRTKLRHTCFGVPESQMSVHLPYNDQTLFFLFSYIWFWEKCTESPKHYKMNKTTHICVTIPPPLATSFSPYCPTIYRFQVTYDFTLNTIMVSKVPQICATSVKEYYIPLLRPAILSYRLTWESGPNDTKWIWGLRYLTYIVLVSPSPKFQCVSL